jgi:surface antigen
LATVVASGYRSPVTNQTSLASEQATVETVAPVMHDEIAPVNQAEAADLAAAAATVADLSVANSVSSKSISINTKQELAQTDDTVVSKPQIAQPSVATEVITTYQAVEGDNVASVAALFGVSEQTIQWANNLSGDNIAPGASLVVPSVDGIVYDVKDGDDLEKIASKYQSDTKSIATLNDLEISGLQPNTRIVIPGGVLPENERPGYVAPRRTTTVTTTTVTRLSNYNVTVMAGNRYAYGYCTYYVYNKRVQAGRPIGSLWGNATTWAANARAAGYRVDNVPEVGAIMQTSGGWGGYGHVAFVESVHADGSITISEMNYAGWNVVSSRTVVNPGDYNFIH